MKKASLEDVQLVEIGIEFMENLDVYVAITFKIGHQ